MLELGSGYGHMINNVTARRQIAVDIWDNYGHYLKPGIESRVADLSFAGPPSVNFAFTGNFFERIGQECFSSVLAQLRRVQAADGTLNPGFPFLGDIERGTPDAVSRKRGAVSSAN